MQDAYTILTDDNDALTLRVWDEGYSETFEDVDANTDYAARANEEWGKGNWGDGDYRILYSWEVTNTAGEIVAEGEGMIEHSRPEPECPKNEHGHKWTSEHEGGCTENPGVWSLGGTAMRFNSTCRCCGMPRTKTTTGTQFNPGECDETEYGDPDPEWVARHYGDE